MGIVQELGAVCRELREERGLGYIHIGVHIQQGHGQGRRSLEPFEEGEQEPEYLSEVVRGYCLGCNVRLTTILDRVRERVAAKEAEMLPLEEDDPMPDEGRAESA